MSGVDTCTRPPRPEGDFVAEQVERERLKDPLWRFLRLLEMVHSNSSEVHMPGM